MRERGNYYTGLEWVLTSWNEITFHIWNGRAAIFNTFILLSISQVAHSLESHPKGPPG